MTTNREDEFTATEDLADILKACEEEVATWPEWKRSIDLYEPTTPARKRRE